MKSQIGYRETSSALIIFSLAPVFSVLVGKNSQAMGYGAVYNCGFCLLISCFFILMLNLYFKKFDSRSIVDVSESFGKFISWIITLTISCLTFSLSVLCVSSLSQVVSSLVYERIEIKNIRLVICITSSFCALLGLESITRQSYVLYYISIVILALTILSVFNGLNPDNLYPLFGTDIRHTIFNVNSFSVLSFIAPFLLVCDRISEHKAYNCIKRSLCFSYAITIIMFLLYTLSVAKPLGSIFGTSLDAIFASSSSGSFFHRFELFMASLYVIFAIVGSAFSLLAVSCGFASLCKIEDVRPFVIILSAIFYSLSAYKTTDNLYLSLCLITSFVSVTLPSLFLLIKRKCGK